MKVAIAAAMFFVVGCFVAAFSLTGESVEASGTAASRGTAAR